MSNRWLLIIRKDGRYSPEYDNYFDPLEDPSYSFAFRTPTYVRKEDADSRGDVTGVYSYIDDVGERHVVQYEAGAEKGFNVLTAFPDNVPAPGYHLGPGDPPRGRSTILQNRDGSYRLVDTIETIHFNVVKQYKIYL